jgi:NitT/TauT family transport system substrate-binding protein
MTMLRAARAILIVCGLVWISAPARAETITIAVGGIDKLSYLPARLTERLGYFADEGLDVQLVGTAGGVQAENQLVAGQAQAVVGFFDHLLDLQSKGDIDLDIPTIFGRKTIF